MYRTSKPCRLRGKPGLTLLDLLIALTIVGLLAAMLFPVFASARRRANLSTCASHLHKLGYAIQMYQADHDEQLPPMDRKVPLYSGVMNVLTTYGVSHNDYQCPEEWESYQTGSSYVFRFTFDINADLWGKAESTRLPPLMQVVPQPQSVLAFCPWHLPYGREWAQTIQTPGYLILRANGGVERVPQKNMQIWQYNKDHDKDYGKWLPPGTPLRVGTLFFYAFPKEPFPPTLRDNSRR